MYYRLKYERENTDLVYFGHVDERENTGLVYYRIMYERENTDLVYFSHVNERENRSHVLHSCE